MNSALTSQEKRILGAIRELPPESIRQVEDFVVFVAARSSAWSYSDSSSLARAGDLMARDPNLRRESQAIDAEFAETESDGLEAY